jgi:hypothetical protein
MHVAIQYAFLRRVAWVQLEVPRVRVSRLTTDHGTLTLTMSVLRNLPLDILPYILDHLTARPDLVAAVLVSKSFYSAATPFLYRSISLLPWNKHSRDQVRSIHPVTRLKVDVSQVFRLFTTLELCPRLARHVRRLG